MNPNPLSDREKALENQYIREKEIQMAKERAAKNQAAKNASSTTQGQQDASKDK
ncbi:hypothetical protein QBC40DRAFT_272519 [Triangularia verruculosa]|uniref:Uncharacterized protein n=1 Tax=Triangularia verruculosa TaxID=2587418 RepID=A0AAN7B132_9PEZI|nr:hypothetical protein QBC40DRAFT_272519 [Triangularia verruculosa]